VILILSDPHDSHVAPVAAELSRRGAAWTIVDPAAFPRDLAMSVAGGPRGERLLMAWDGGGLDLAEVRSVWYRRPGTPRLAAGLAPEEERWLGVECDQFLRGCWSALPAFWVSPPHRIRAAMLKLDQLRLARRLGLRVPRYLVTNDPAAAREFVAAAPGPVVAKSLGLPSIRYQDRELALPTQVVTAVRPWLLEGGLLGPTFLQDLVPKRREVRLTVIGERAVAVAIETAGVPEAAVDMRLAGFEALPHRPVELPAGVIRACRRMVGRLGLRFAAIDLLETDDGYVFLELNPNGQWLWLELMTGAPLAAMLCDLLLAPARGMPVAVRGGAASRRRRARGEPVPRDAGRERARA
jgi:MvdD-like protein with pre-ATP grasp domain